MEIKESWLNLILWYLTHTSFPQYSITEVMTIFIEPSKTHSKLVKVDKKFMEQILKWVMKAQNWGTVLTSGNHFVYTLQEMVIPKPSMLSYYYILNRHPEKKVKTSVKSVLDLMLLRIPSLCLNYFLSSTIWSAFFF